jgi:hypothetical protein
MVFNEFGLVIMVKRGTTWLRGAPLARELMTIPIAQPNIDTDLDNSIDHLSVHLVMGVFVRNDWNANLSDTRL